MQQSMQTLNEHLTFARTLKLVRYKLFRSRAQNENDSSKWHTARHDQNNGPSWERSTIQCPPFCLSLNKKYIKKHKAPKCLPLLQDKTKTRLAYFVLELLVYTPYVLPTCSVLVKTMGIDIASVNLCLLIKMKKGRGGKTQGVNTYLRNPNKVATLSFFC